MTWYLYTGRMAMPIQTGMGNVVSVQPHTKVEVLKQTPNIRKLIARGLLHRTGKPMDMKPRVKKVESPANVIEKSKLARFVAEKGVTSGKDVPPKSATVAEKTEGELVVAKKVDSGIVDSVDVSPETEE